MKIMYICRLFSGLAESLHKKVWNPHGVPTVYKLIEAIDQSEHELQLVFTIKDTKIDWPHRKTTSFNIQGLRNPVTVIPKTFRALPRHIRNSGYTRELFHYLKLHSLIKTFTLELIYFDRVNIYSAALTAHRTQLPVVWRVMGVPPAMHDVVESRGIVARITRWAYRAPFSMVICSKDGSGGEQWMNKTLAKTTPRKTLINGADYSSGGAIPAGMSAFLSPSKTNVLFVSRFVKNKGCREFIKAACAVLERAPESFSFFLVGGGPCEKQMRKLAASSTKSEHIHFLGEQPHRRITSIQKACDIYVSLNEMCNLTNANLEAMRSGACIIMPSSPGIRGIDIDTDRLVPNECVWRISAFNDTIGLVDALLYLHNNPDQRKTRSQLTEENAKKIIPLWADRIKNELDLLQKLAIKVVK